MMVVLPHPDGAENNIAFPIDVCPNSVNLSSSSLSFEFLVKYLVESLHGG